MAAPDRWRCWRGACPSGRTLRARRPGCRRRRARMPWAAGWGRPGGVTSRCARLHAAYRLHRTHASTHAASRAWTALPCPDGQCMRDGARCTRVSVPCANLYQRDAHLCQALWRTKRKDFAKQQAQALIRAAAHAGRAAAAAGGCAAGVPALPGLALLRRVLRRARAFQTPLCCTRLSLCTLRDCSNIRRLLLTICVTSCKL